jgi:signal transduction histidine kinase
VVIGTEPLLRVLCITDDPALGALVQEAIATSLPSTVTDVEDGEWVPVDSLARATCMILDGKLDHSSGLDALRRFRASGFRGAAVMLLAEPSASITMRAAAMGAPITVLKRDIASRLPGAVVAAARTSLDSSEWRMMYDDLRRTQRFIALGQIAARLRHDLSNPMTVISSELQMFDMDASFPERSRESVKEMLVMCRRVNAIVRELDGLMATPFSAVSEVPSGRDG